MEIITNPVTISVIVLCVLSLFKLNVLLSMLIACVVGGLIGGMDVPSIMSTLTGGFSGNATTALSYILLGTFATAIATTGLAEILSKKLSRIIGGKKLVLLGAITLIACLSQNLIPVHIAYIPILIPPMLAMMNEMKLDRRAAACCLAFGHKAPYIAIPFGFGLQFMTIIRDNLTENGMPVTINEITSVNWILALSMVIGLLIAVFFSYRKPREYKMVAADTSASDAISEKLEYRHYITIVAAVVVVVVQVVAQDLALSALCGIMVMIVFGAIKWNQIDDQLAGGVKLMGLIAFVMLVAGGYAEVMKATGGVNALVEAGIAAMGGSKIIAAIVITLIGHHGYRHFLRHRASSGSAVCPPVRSDWLLSRRHDPADVRGCRSGRRWFSCVRHHPGPHVRSERRRPARPHLGHLRAHLPPLQHPADDRRGDWCTVPVSVLAF